MMIDRCIIARNASWTNPSSRARFSPVAGRPVGDGDTATEWTARIKTEYYFGATGTCWFAALLACWFIPSFLVENDVFFPYRRWCMLFIHWYGAYPGCSSEHGYSTDDTSPVSRSMQCRLSTYGTIGIDINVDGKYNEFTQIDRCTLHDERIDPEHSYCLVEDIVTDTIRWSSCDNYGMLASCWSRRAVLIDIHLFIWLTMMMNISLYTVVEPITAV